MSVLAPTDGVAQLQLARTAALAKVDEARTRRVKRLKEAKDDAKAEIELYKSIQDTHYVKLEDQINSNKGGFEECSKRFTEEQLNAIKISYNANKEAALNLLMSTILDIQPQVHVNFKMTS